MNSLFASPEIARQKSPNALMTFTATSALDSEAFATTVEGEVDMALIPQSRRPDRVSHSERQIPNAMVTAHHRRVTRKQPLAIIGVQIIAN